MTEKGLVTKVTGKSISVKMFPLTNCGECKACDAHRRSSTTIEIENNCNASVGDYVSVQIKETILSGAIIFYGIPLLAFLVGILLGWMLTPIIVPESLQEPITAVIGIVFLLITYLGIRIAEPFIKKCVTMPMIITVLSDDSEQNI